MRRYGCAAVLMVVVALGSGSCGSGGSGGTEDNDQGVSFRAVGFFRGEEEISETEIQCTVPTVEDAISDFSFTLSLSQVFDFPRRTDPNANPCGGFIELENNLFQAINVERIEFQYDIPGATIPIPSNDSLLGVRINAVDSTDPSPSGAPNIVFIQLVGQMVPQKLVTFLNQNFLSLPQLPFTMTIRATALGRAEDGDVFVTNEIRYTIEWVP